ncbi:amino acid adenylation domain protein [Candidatus Moduliflexus flocculans]|uniref:Amino acid adenylation domain protein n=1 Tax=Candidatus Moduliflexus flocculans TaxID=1499966 RepID=A0A081BM33_9BACT|nr:amino acid adenylation domain protein [Candidatus Moduliflexus flocculans]
MTLAEFLDEIYRLDIRIFVSGERLHYRDPHHALTPELRAKLDHYETTLLAYLRRPQGDSLPFYPLSSIQKTLWVLYQSAPHSEAYNIKFDARIFSKIDIPAFRRALQGLIDRHVSLRTTYITIDGEPVQQIQEQQEVCFDVIDATDWESEERNRCLQEKASQPFDLAHGPLLRASLFSLPKGQYIFWLLIHHIAADFCSLEILINELGVLYAAEIANHPSPLPPLSRQYTDYIRWKLDMLAGAEGEWHRAYFQHRFDGELPILHLPTDRPRPPAQTYHTSSRFFPLSAALTQRLHKTAKRERTTLHALLVSAYVVFLRRHTGQEDMIIGIPASEQGHRHFKGVVGFFDNPLPLRADLSGNPTFRALLRSVHQGIWEAFDHADYPTHLLAKELHLHRDASHPPLFQTIFMLQESQREKNILPFLVGQGDERIDVGGLTMISMGQEEQMMTFVDLQVTMLEDHGSFLTYWQYNSDLFDETTIECMAERFQVLLEGITANPEERIGYLPILTDMERHTLLVEWNQTATDYPKNACIHELFEEQVIQTPDAVAVVYNGERLTYQELNQRANQLAHYLRKYGVGPDVPVGLCLERSIEMVVGLLGILKAGGAYVPLDSSFPNQRLTKMIEDAELSVIITQKMLDFRQPLRKVQTIAFDVAYEEIASESSENLPLAVTSRTRAYIMYTSGSTGEPKGVCIVHQGVIRLVKGTNYITFSPEDTILQLAPISFDASTFEIWGSLLNGATLVLMPGVKPSLKQIAQAIRIHKISTLWLTAGLFHLMIEEHIDDLRSIHQLLAGGDVLSPEHVHKALHTLTDCTLINGYGPTENTTFSCCFPMKGGTLLKNHSIPIGRPIANSQAYILDRHLQPLPIGVAGELFVGGDGLAREYLHASELTHEKFIPHPFSDEPSARLYKTGDIARFLPDGNIEFLGRYDQQVKIRGFRVELGEIETALKNYPVINDVVITTQEHIPG